MATLLETLESRVGAGPTLPAGQNAGLQPSRALRPLGDALAERAAPRPTRALVPQPSGLGPEVSPLFRPLSLARSGAGLLATGAGLLAPQVPSLGPLATGAGTLAGLAGAGAALTDPTASGARRALGVTSGALSATRALTGLEPVRTAVPALAPAGAVGAGLGAAAAGAGVGLSILDLIEGRTAAGVQGLVLGAPGAVAAGAQLAASGALGTTAAAGGTASGIAAGASTLALATLPLAAITLVGSLVSSNEGKKKFQKISGNIDEARVAVGDIATALQDKPLPEALGARVSIGGNPTVGGLLRAVAEMNLQGRFSPEFYGLPRHGKSRNPDLYRLPDPKYGAVVALLDQMGIKPETNVEWGTLFSYGGTPPVFSILDALAEQASRVPGLGTGPQAMPAEQYTQNFIQQGIRQAGGLAAFAAGYWENLQDVEMDQPNRPDPSRGERAWMPAFLRDAVDAYLIGRGLGPAEARAARRAEFAPPGPPNPHGTES